MKNSTESEAQAVQGPRLPGRARICWILARKPPRHRGTGDGVASYELRVGGYEGRRGRTGRRGGESAPADTWVGGVMKMKMLAPNFAEERGAGCNPKIGLRRRRSKRHYRHRPRGAQVLPRIPIAGACDSFLQPSIEPDAGGRPGSERNDPRQESGGARPRQKFSASGDASDGVESAPRGQRRIPNGLRGVACSAARGARGLLAHLTNKSRSH